VIEEEKVNDQQTFILGKSTSGVLPSETLKFKLFI